MIRNSQTGKRRIGRPGHVAAAARALGVERSHLWRVIKGERQSRRAMTAYLEWRKRKVGQ